MKLIPTPLKGAFLIELSPHVDERGLFARTFCRDTFVELGLHGEFIQNSTSYNRKKGTVRGMHFQTAPHEEIKLIRCTRGAVYDVIIDLREDSPTFKKYYGVELSADNRRMMYVPKGFAHGFQTLTDDAEVYYEMSTVYVEESAAGVRWNDSAFGIKWPEPQARIISERDAHHPDFKG